MKILLAVHHFPPHYSAGAELYTYRLARWLLAHGHQAEVVCIETLAETRPSAITAEYEVYQEVPVWRLHLGLRGASADWSYANPLVAGWVGEHMRQSPPDLLHLHSGYLIGAGVLEEAQTQGIATVVTLHDYWFVCPRFTLLRGDGKVCASIPEDPAGCGWCLKLDQRRYRLPEQVSRGLAGRVWLALGGGGERVAQAERRAYLQRVLAKVDLALAPSAFLAERYATLLPAERLQVVRLGIDRERLAGVARPVPSTLLRLGYLGQVAPHKGVHVLIEALRRLPTSGRPVQLQIFGNLEQNPAYAQQLRNLIANDPRIILAGRFRSDQLPEVLTNLDATVVPSIWYENSPMAIMEAHAAGRPVITARLGGMAELVRDEVDGLHFTAGDVAELARQIERLRNEPGLLARLQAGVPQLASVDDEMQTLVKLYSGLQQQPTTPISTPEVV